MELGIQTNSNDGAVVYFHSSEDMSEVEDKSAKLVMGPSVFLGKGVEWDEYAKLYYEVYVKNLRRVIRDDGVFIVIQTNAYVDGKFLCRYQNLLDLFDANDVWELIDERVWKRKAADHFQVPFSHVLVFAPSGGSFKRRSPKGKQFFQGVWEFKQTKGSDKASYPESLCRMVIEACTEPGDLIVDPFAGSAQLLATAKHLGRKAVGYEIDEKMVPLIEKRGVKVVRS